MKKLLTGILLLGTFAAFCADIRDTEGQYELSNTFAGECLNHAEVDTRGDNSGNFILIGQMDGLTEYYNAIELDKTGLVHGWGPYSHKYINTFKENGKIKVHVYLARTFKLKIELEYNFAKANHLIITKKKKNKIVSMCEFKKVY